MHVGPETGEMDSLSGSLIRGLLLEGVSQWAVADDQQMRLGGGLSTGCDVPSRGPAARRCRRWVPDPGYRIHSGPPPDLHVCSV
jgi:hypothetical protein